MDSPSVRRRGPPSACCSHIRRMEAPGRMLRNNRKRKRQVVRPVLVTGHVPFSWCRSSGQTAIAGPMGCSLLRRLLHQLAAHDCSQKLYICLFSCRRMNKVNWQSTGCLTLLALMPELHSLHAVQAMLRFMDCRHASRITPSYMWPLLDCSPAHPAICHPAILPHSIGRNVTNVTCHGAMCLSGLQPSTASGNVETKHCV